ncbi:uncharacterized protein LOC128888078 [Hylaeus anthracinus]|uniref:uncharacterized protein LOC128888078 n=1 Tax=Hylaeus anthracinus TaxID=313031 RepID=UPI0023BA073E|nr:uncharacterized protein LOC128888078 [Hylaeus anthracinus]
MLTRKTLKEYGEKLKRLGKQVCEEEQTETVSAATAHEKLQMKEAIEIELDGRDIVENECQDRQEEEIKDTRNETEEELHRIVNVVMQTETATDEEEYLVVEKETTKSDEKLCRSDGFSIVDMHHVFDQIKLIGEHSETFECSTRHLEIKGLKRSGLNSTLILECRMCNYRAEVHSQPENAQVMNTTENAVAANIQWRRLRTNGGLFDIYQCPLHVKEEI